VVAISCFLALLTVLALYPPYFHSRGGGSLGSTPLEIPKTSPQLRSARAEDILLTHQYDRDELQWSVLRELTDTCKELKRRTSAGTEGAATQETGIPDAGKPLTEPLTMWATDFHISPIADIKVLLGAETVRAGQTEAKNEQAEEDGEDGEEGEKQGKHEKEEAQKVRRAAGAAVRVYDHSLSGHCHLSNTCADRSELRYLNRDNGLVLGTCPNKLRSAFYEYYAHDQRQSHLRDADAFLCLHAASLCELYMPFNRTMIIISSTRYELGRGEEEHMYGHYDPWEDPHFTAQYESLGFDESAHVQKVNEHYGARWQTWNRNLRRISGGLLGDPADCPAESSPQSWVSHLVMSTFPRCQRRTRRNHVIGANNLYDKYYMEYFTGIRDVMLLPSTAQHVAGIPWNYPTRHEERLGRGGSRQRLHLPVLLGPSHNVHSTVEKLLQDALFKARNATDKNAQKDMPKIMQISHLYPGHFDYSELADHPAVVIIPYQVSIMSFYEFYRMGIPIFLPTARLLTQWHVEHRILKERSWPMTRNRPQRSSMIPPFAKRYQCGVDCQKKHHKLPELFKHDPNNEFSAQAVAAWLQLCDYYTWPHVVLYDSPEELVELLKPRRSLLPALQTISRSMRQFMTEIDGGVKLAWSYILEGIAQDRKSRGYTDSQSYPATLNRALQEQYGYQLSSEDCYQEVFA